MGQDKRDTLYDKMDMDDKVDKDDEDNKEEEKDMDKNEEEICFAKIGPTGIWNQIRTSAFIMSCCYSCYCYSSSSCALLT